MNKIRRAVWYFFKKILFKINAEKAHRLMVHIIRFGIYFRNFPLRVMSGANLERCKIDDNKVFGLEFLSKVGLAAGFDKDCEILLGLPALGFGFAEIGTITPLPQSGNQPPRLFRDIRDQALFNRMGFNGIGAIRVAERLYRQKPRLPEKFRVGVNLGKNKDTPLESAYKDYICAARAFEGLADYLVINVSSPNTPGLRSLQTIEALRPITSGVMNLISGWRRKVPLLLKLAPEIKGEELEVIVKELEALGSVDGWVLTNTLKQARFIQGQWLEGGVSGKPLQEESRNRCIEMRKLSYKPIISVGGIDSVEEANLRLSSGANLIQIYTSWVYQGPQFPGILSQVLHS